MVDKGGGVSLLRDFSVVEGRFLTEKGKESFLSGMSRSGVLVEMASRPASGFSDLSLAVLVARS